MTVLHAFEDPIDALVVGANGGLGGAFVDALLSDANVRSVRAWSRRDIGKVHPKLQSDIIDAGDEAQLKAAANQIDRLTLVVIATGVLHSPQGMAPEKSWRSIEPELMAESFRVNAILPSQIVRHTLPLIPRKGRSALCAISARVGSISDNRLGGWHSYRASKAALNQLIQCLSIEMRRTHPEALCLALHPGTVDTDLSRPFQKSLAAGHRLLTPAESVDHLFAVINSATPDQTGRLLTWEGEVVDP